MSFSSHLDLGKMIIALDGIKKCLLVLDTGREVKRPTIIDLNEVAVVAVKKSYGSITQEELNYKGLEQFLEKIDLQFELTRGKPTIVLPFYDHSIDKLADRRKLERNADTWRMILSKMLGGAISN
ncbi:MULTISPECIES: hypothetical protein [Niastella]|uniref:Uncharacterized protein n=1 Tax=Niastella soli TaxID=2821487 RepID=A0ABS3YYL3_9BACT|nr:hypothetical protein [Niastella soli]MBO9202828.1 hypothetical protein [Niastella soli]